MPKTLNLEVSIVTQRYAWVYEDVFLTKLHPYFLNQWWAGTGEQRERQTVQDRLWLSLRGGDRGFPRVNLSEAPTTFEGKWKKK